MTFTESIILGAIQGLTEFLPVSSSGHLELANYLFGIHEPNSLQFTMALHGGTVLATIAVFRRELWRLTRGVCRFRWNDETVFAFNILISMLPILFVGMMFRDRIAGMFTGNLMLVGTMLLVTAGLLTFSHFAKTQRKQITPKSAFIMGLAQAAAVVPGLSRSGTTISAGLLQGVKREEVSKFSFLMVLIPIIGMNVLEISSGAFSGESVAVGTVAAGFITAFITGTLACRWMIKLVNKGKLVWFAVYCVAAGLFSIITYLW